jgi:hypothetical protein
MAPVVIWILVALLTAGAVLLVASVADGRSSRSSGDGNVLQLMRSGVRRSRGAGRGRGLLADARRELAETADVETSSVDEIFVIGEHQPAAYVGTEELTQTLHRARRRAARGVAQIARR